MLKKVIIILAFTVIHFALSMVVIPIAISRILGLSESTAAGSSLLLEILLAATRILYFPIISLSLYSRHWFPGNWIYVPIVANSLLWALAVYFLGAVLKSLLRSR